MFIIIVHNASFHNKSISDVLQGWIINVAIFRVDNASANDVQTFVITAKQKRYDWYWQ